MIAGAKAAAEAEGLSLRFVGGPSGDRWRLTPAGDDGAWLLFDDAGTAPHVVEIVNATGVRGWGSRMVRTLAGLFPTTNRWTSTDVLDTGVLFWSAMQTELGVTLFTASGVPALSTRRAIVARLLA
ncbi:hypothetical protein ACFWGN_11940 [Oerskovia sp. NPDC060338]|uniref:hypothetical protein n=1 Tax=Oerskovia sp. NPDC060338 TaxID=3347100 RepID=UPI0036654FC8